MEPTHENTSPPASDLSALANALEIFNATTRSMEEAYRRLENRVHELDKELAQKNRELAFSTEYLSNLLESMSDGVIAVDTEGKITRFNRAAGAILGYSAPEVTGHSFHEVFKRNFAASRNPGAMELRAKSGRMVPISERDSPISGSTGKKLGSVKTFQDLSELIALREQVRQIDRLAAIGEMAATVAHEIRNPLGGIRGFATFLANDIAADDPRRRLVDKILQGTQSLDKVVNELLEYTRPVELSLHPVSCEALLESAIGFLQYDSTRIQIKRNIPKDLKVLADRDKIAQVFLNVLLNSVQSITENGSILVEITTDASAVDIYIRDTGCGMDESHLKQVFSPFFTTKEKGTGLGLAVCKKIVEGHGGDLDAKSEPGIGTTMHVRLLRAE